MAQGLNTLKGGRGFDPTSRRNPEEKLEVRKSQRRNISHVCEIRHLSNDPINISDQKQGARRIITIAKLNIRASAIPHKSEEGIALTAHQINEKEASHAIVLSRKMEADMIGQRTQRP